MLRIAAICVLAMLPAAGQSSAKWTALFDGKSLNGWTPKISGYPLGENFGNTFRVENGVLKVGYDKYDKFSNRFGHLFYKNKFANYRLAIEYRFTGAQATEGPAWAWRNSGVMIHSQPPGTMTKDQDFPISIEVQFLGGRGTGERTTANLCTPGTNVVMEGKLFTPHCVNSKSKTYHGDQWVRAEVEVRGSHVRHIVDGQTVLEYDQPQVGGGNVTNFGAAAKKDGMMLTEGYIALQSESHPIEFRKVEIMELKP